MTGLADKLEVSRAAQADGDDPASALSIFEKIQRQQEVVAKALPGGMDAERFIRMVLTEVRRTPKLAQCDPATLIGAMMLSAQTGLEPGGPLGQAFLIPRWSGRRKVMECQFQIGYKGYVQLAARSGVTLIARTVREGDAFDWQYGTDEFIHHRPVLDSVGKSVAWYAIGQFADGRKPVFVVIDRNATEAAKNAGAAGDRGPWSTHYEAMGEKTAANRLQRWLPLSTDVATAVAADGLVVAGPVASLDEAANAALPDDDPAEAIEADATDPELATEVPT